MGLSIAISGGIVLIVILLIFAILPSISEKIQGGSSANSERNDLEDSISKTNVKLFGVNASSGSNLVNFTMRNVGNEKLWNFDEFDLFITYDADISGTPTRVTEQFSFNETAFGISTGQVTLTPDFRIQRGVAVFGAGGGAANDVIDVTIVPVSSIGNGGNAFVRITNVEHASAGDDDGTAPDRNNDDLGVRAELTAPNNIRFTRLASGQDGNDVRVAWEVWEYKGKEGGDNEFIVSLDTEVTLTGAVADTNVPNFVDRDKLVPFITGLTHTGTARDWDDATFSAMVGDFGSGNTVVRIERSTTSGTGVVGIAVVEFTGSNWKVHNNISHVYQASGSNEQETFAGVADWNQAFIVRTHRTGAGQDDLDETGYNAWAGPTNNEINFRLEAGAGGVGSGDYVSIVHVLESPFISVQHLDSITGGQTDFASGANTELRTIATVDDMDETAIVATANINTGSEEYPRQFWNYRLSADDTVEFFRGRSGGAITQWALDVIEFPRTERCIGGTSNIIGVNEWTIDCTNYEHFEPGIINTFEEPEILTKLQYPIFANGLVKISLSTDNGSIDIRNVTVN